MGQQDLIYSFVARGTVILADCTERDGNHTGIAKRNLEKLASTSDKSTSTSDKFTYTGFGHTFNYLVKDGFTYCVVAVETIGRQIPIAFLERVKEDFTKKYGGGKADKASENSLNKEFGPKLKEHMQHCVDHQDEISKLVKVRAQVTQVTEVKMESIEEVPDGGEKNAETENRRSQAQDSKRQETETGRKTWLQNLCCCCQ